MAAAVGAAAPRCRGLSRAALLALALVFALPSLASAFAIFDAQGGLTPQEVLEGANRFPPSTGAAAPISVGVEIGFAGDVGAVGAAEIAMVNQAVLDAFEAWESAALEFDVALEDAGVVEGPTQGFEIDVLAVPGTHPMFAGTSFFGRADVDVSFALGRALTNGQSSDGFVVNGGDVFINQDAVAIFSQLGDQQRLDALTRLLAHEIGHVLGLGHPNSNNPFGAEPSYDTDSDPLNTIVIDGAMPFAGFAVSANTDDTAIMSNRPCGDPPVTVCSALFFTLLRPDDAAGRDVLYPVPEASAFASGTVAGLALACLRRRSAASRSA